MLRSVPRSIRAALAMLFMLPLVPNAGHAATNLAPNPGFERWVAESHVARPGAIGPVDDQKEPLLPEGWGVEGLAGHFHHQRHRARTGQFAVRTVHSYAGKPEYIVDAHRVESPLTPVQNQAMTHSSTMPVWRNVTPIRVKAGATYNLSVYTSQTGITGQPIYGAASFVRWVDANGVGISVGVGARRAWKSTDPNTPDGYTDWFLLSRNLPAPNNAAGAVILLGAGYDVTPFSGVAFDDVSFTCVSAC